MIFNQQGASSGGGGATHIITNVSNPNPSVFDYDSMAFVHDTSPQFEEGTPVIVGTESSYRTFSILRTDTAAEVPSVTLGSSTTYGWRKVFIMPDCDVTVSMGTSPGPK